MRVNKIKVLCEQEEGQGEVLQGNIAFAVGCVRSGIHSADGYPGTPSTEVIDKGLSLVQDKITVGWSLNEAVAISAAFGHTLAGRDSVVTMKIPGLFQAGDIFTSSSFFTETRGALVHFIASDFTPSSTQHLVDPHYLFKSCFLPVFEPRNHQEMLEAAGIAADIGRRFKTPAVVFASGGLCHSEGLVKMTPIESREPIDMGKDLRAFNLLPVMARNNYDTVRAERMVELTKMVEESPLNKWIKGSGKVGIITSGINTSFALEVKEALGDDIDILSLGFTNPLPEKLINEFHSAISGKVYVLDDGYKYLQEEITLMGLEVHGKDKLDSRTEYTPASVAALLGSEIKSTIPVIAPAVKRPPMICPGCPYGLFAQTISTMKRRGKLEAIFGDIGCNALLYFMNSLDTGLAMGASEAKRMGFVLSRPDMADKCISVLGDGTECHSGMDATRNTVFRNVPGVKVVLDNYWTAMTGGQPSASSPVNLAGDACKFDLLDALKGTGAKVVAVNAYDRKELQTGLRHALKDAADGEFTTLVVRGCCLKKLPPAQKGIRLKIDKDKCQQCDSCLICSGISKGKDGYPEFNNLCSGCGEQGNACMEMCPHKAMVRLTKEEMVRAAAPKFDEPPAIAEAAFDKDALPGRLSLAIRGVGGQGNLFFGKVLTQVAFLSGYGEKNIVKGETHGMAQMGGPVISTFACGEVHSPVLLPGEADCLIAMEMSEILRPGFLELLRPNGTIIAANTMLVPQGMDVSDYPEMDAIRKAAEGFNLVEIDVLNVALGLGDTTGRIANVVMMGALSMKAPFNNIPEHLWLGALKGVTPAPAWAGNYEAFMAGKKLL